VLWVDLQMLHLKPSALNASLVPSSTTPAKPPAPLALPGITRTDMPAPSVNLVALVLTILLLNKLVVFLVRLALSTTALLLFLVSPVNLASRNSLRVLPRALNVLKVLTSLLLLNRAASSVKSAAIKTSIKPQFVRCVLWDATPIKSAKVLASSALWVNSIIFLDRAHVQAAVWVDFRMFWVAQLALLARLVLISL
jgi:hypothetical protein